MKFISYLKPRPSEFSGCLAPPNSSQGYVCSVTVIVVVIAIVAVVAVKDAWFEVLAIVFLQCHGCGFEGWFQYSRVACHSTADYSITQSDSESGNTGKPDKLLEEAHCYQR